MANQYNSKIVLSNGEVLMDLTQDDIKPEHVQNGIHFHDKSGASKTGTNTKTVDASNVTAEAAEVLKGKTFGKGNRVEEGTMPDNSGKNITITSKTGALIPLGYSDGTSKVVLSETDFAKLIPANIKEGVTLLGVVGEFGADDISSQSKNVTPTFSEQTILPDEGISFLSSIKVAAIGVSRQDNEAGGVTVTIG